MTAHGALESFWPYYNNNITTKTQGERENDGDYHTSRNVSYAALSTEMVLRRSISRAHC
jgi:hypothetical protein